MAKFVSKKLVLILFIMGLCFLYGCGSDENSTSSNSSSSSAAVPTISPSASAEPQMAKIVLVKDADSGLRVRSSASTDGDILGIAYNGDKFKLLLDEKQGDWYQIVYEGKNAYVYADYVTVQQVTLAEANALDDSSSTDSSASANSSEAGNGATPVPTATATPDNVSKSNEDGEA